MTNKLHYFFLNYLKNEDNQLDQNKKNPFFMSIEIVVDLNNDELTCNKFKEFDALLIDKKFD